MSNEVPFGKKEFKYFIVYNGAKGANGANFFQKYLHIEKTLMKLNIYLTKKWWKIQWNLGKRIVSKNNLIVKQYTMKNI